jgi:dienelactone hydrolase
MVLMTAVAERPVVFGESGHLFGVECRPATPGGGAPRPPVLFVNAGIVHRVGPHRIYVKLARALAADGVASLRFDLSGLGSSRPRPGDPRPREEVVRADLDDGLRFLKERMRSERVVTAGLCSGADRAFDAALRHPEVSGCILLDPDVHLTRGHRMHEVGSALSRGRTWASLVNGRYLRRALARAPEAERTRAPRDEMAVTTLPARETREQEIASLLRRRVALHALFTGGLLERYNHRDQYFEAYPEAARIPGVHLSWLPEADHTFSTRDAQETLIHEVLVWYRGAFPPEQQC